MCGNSTEFWGLPWFLSETPHYFIKLSPWNIPLPDQNVTWMTVMMSTGPNFLRFSNSICLDAKSNWTDKGNKHFHSNGRILQYWPRLLKAISVTMFGKYIKVKVCPCPFLFRTGIEKLSHSWRQNLRVPGLPFQPSIYCICKHFYVKWVSYSGLKIMLWLKVVFVSLFLFLFQCTA